MLDITFKYTHLDLFMSCPRQALIYKETRTRFNLKEKKPRVNPFDKVHFWQSIKNEKIAISNKKLKKLQESKN